MERDSSVEADEQQYCAQFLRSAGDSGDESAIAPTCKSLTYADVKNAYGFSQRFGRLSTPSGSTALYLHYSKVRSNGQTGVVQRRHDYYTRGLQSEPERAVGKRESHASAGRSNTQKPSVATKPANADDVQFIVTNMGRTTQERRSTCRQIEAAEKSVREGGKRRRQIKNAVLMGSFIIALPAELSTSQRRELTTQICGPFGSAGLFYLAVGHLPSQFGDQRNHHLHLIFNLRPHRLEDDRIVFADRVDRRCQGPQFLKRFRQHVAACMNTAIEAANLPRRVFGGTYAQNGLTFVTSRRRIPIRDYQRRRRGQGVGPLDAGTAPSLVKDKENVNYVELMGSIVSALSARARAERQTAELQRQSAVLAQQRRRAFDEAMKRILRDGHLFAFDKDTGVLHHGLWINQRLNHFMPIDRNGPRQPVSKEISRPIDRFIKKHAAEIIAWTKPNEALLIKAWAANPAHAVTALQTLGANISFDNSGALKVGAGPRKQDRKGLLSWLANAITTQAATEVTSILLGRPFNPIIARDLAHESAQSRDHVSAYARKLYACSSDCRMALAAVRLHSAKLAHADLTLDTITIFDSRIEQQLLNWQQGPFLIQEHRKHARVYADEGPNAPEISCSLRRYQQALDELGESAMNRNRPLKSPVQNTVAAAYGLFGSCGWKSSLQDSLTTLFDQIKWHPSQDVVDCMSTFSITLPDSSVVHKKVLKDLAQQAFDSTKMYKHRVERWQQQRRAQNVRS
jgi:hypothetical protein